jgi:hypothetical protein
MQRWLCFAWVATFVTALSGCGNSDSGDAAADLDPTTSTPEKAVHEFMLAFKTGDDARAAALLTEKARQEADRTGKAVSPPGSKTMVFQVGDGEFVSEAKDGAHVGCKISDTDPEGNTTDYDVLWFLRQQSDGWRVAGVLMKVFEDQPPVLYNFEDQDDMDRKMELVEQEIIRRSQASLGADDPAALEARGQEVSPTAKQ